MSDLSSEKCVPCKGDTPPLKGEELQRFWKRLEEGWELVNEKAIEKSFQFKDFKEALAFVNDIGKVAEEEGHHPDIVLSWGKVKVVYTTHKIQGLSESDFVMAAKTDVCYISRKS
ncbi:MAG: putative pterin-4-alpha-carbinolamine dehydratase [Chlamydiae bacterium]|nr:putative pterin-4-alpha-carbinolamine dehydratase [Chlamydiota bacterium]